MAPGKLNALVRASDALDSGVAVVLETLDSTADRGYEAELEARLAILLIVRHVEGVALLARDGAPMFPAAMTLARSAYEGALRTLWLLDPDEPFERERRWLTHLRDTERFYTASADAYLLAGETEGARRAADVAEAHRQFRLGVEAKLPAHVEAPARRLPTLRDMAAELGREERYFVYRIASQHAHATHVGTGLYRRNLGVAVELGDFAHPGIWRTPLQLTWFALEAPVARLVECVGGNAVAFREALPVGGVAEAIASLPEE